MGSWACVGERRLPGVLQAKTAKWGAYSSAVKRIARTRVGMYVWECSCASTCCCVSMYVVYLCMRACMHVCMSKVWSTGEHGLLTTSPQWKGRATGTGPCPSGACRCHHRMLPCHALPTAAPPDMGCAGSWHCHSVTSTPLIRVWEAQSLLSSSLLLLAAHSVHLPSLLLRASGYK